MTLDDNNSDINKLDDSENTNVISENTNSINDSSDNILDKKTETTTNDNKLFDKYYANITKSYSFPEFTDPDFQKKIYESRRFQFNKIQSKEELETYEQIKEYRDNYCSGGVVLRPHQTFIANFISPSTPFIGLGICWGTGRGKTCAALAAAEKFIPMVRKYNTKIYILVPGPNLKESWKEHLIKCTGDTYTKINANKNANLSDTEKNKLKKIAINSAMAYYKIMSFNSFYKKVSGIRIMDKITTKEGKVKTQYRKTEEGEFERDVSTDRIDRLDNTLLIVDEAHNLTGNFIGDALRQILKVSVNLKIMVLTATPMKNYADDIIDFINFVRPQNSPIERDKIFTPEKNHLMDFKEGGLDYLRNMCKGYISFLRGGDPIVFAKRVEYGIVPKGLLFTKIIPCIMHKFQKTVYDKVVASEGDALDRRSSSVSMFVFPALDQEKKEIVGYFGGRDGLSQVRQQLKNYQELINKKLHQLLTEFVKNDESIVDKSKIIIPTSELLFSVESRKTISGKILKSPFLKYFSIKFYIAFLNLSRLVYGIKESKTAFIYCNFVKTGIEIFQEILLQNGYLEYQENSSYVINSDTICYYCGKTYTDHKNIKKPNQKGGKKHKSKHKKSKHKSKHKLRKNRLEREDGGETPTSNFPPYILTSSESINVPIDSIPYHHFYPATFITVKGATTEEGIADTVPADKQRIIRDVFNKSSNKDGKYIKFILGSRVMNEGISLSNCGEIHILDAYYNFARIDQVVGRGIRECSHYDSITDTNKYPEVSIFKYCIYIDENSSEEISTEQDLYRKAELKHIKIKQVERVLKEVAVDCPLNYNGNIFKHELKEFKDCDTKKDGLCPSSCDYMSCLFKCSDVQLNEEYYDPNRNIYKAVSKSKLDYTTFSITLARSEIDWAKSKIKNMFRIESVYKLKNIINYVKNSYDKENKELFDDFFVFQALDELIPLDENDFNNFKDVVYDSLNNPGYLIYRGKYYIFNPFNEPENAPMHYRTTFKNENHNTLGLHNYIRNIDEKFVSKMETKEITRYGYDFDSVRDYYDSRDENDIIGIIDREPSKKKSKTDDEIRDLFKIRSRRDKILEKKRGTGIPSSKGAVCSTSKDLNYLQDTVKKLGIKIDLQKMKELRKKYSSTKGGERFLLCDFFLKPYLLNLEKYNEENKTYVIIPKNHKEYPFPYNIHDRVKYIQDNLKKEIKTDFEIKVTKIYDKSKISSYVISITNNDKNLKEYINILKKYGFALKKNIWSLIIS